MKFVFILFAFVVLTQDHLASALSINNILDSVKPLPNGVQLDITQAHMNCLSKAGFTRQRAIDGMKTVGQNLLDDLLKKCRKDWWFYVNCDKVTLSYDLVVSPYYIAMNGLPSGWQGFVKPKSVAKTISKLPSAKNNLEKYKKYIGKIDACFKKPAPQK